MMSRKVSKKTVAPKKIRSKKSKTPRFVEHPLSSEMNFANREIGWLQFNRRVLAEAEDVRTPLLERLKFLSICNSNLDEFFMKRVGGLKRQVAFGIAARSSDGKTPTQQLAEIRQFVLPTLIEQANCFQKSIKPELKKHGIHILNWEDLSAAEKAFAQKYYLKNVFPVLTPLSVDPGHPFPFISNLSTSLGVTLRHPNQEEKLFARVKVPQVLPQWIRIESGEHPEDYRFLSLTDLIHENLADLFPAMEVINVMPFRITRNADIVRDEEDAEDLLQLIEEELRMRRFAEVVRLEHGPNPDPWILKFLKEELELQDEDVYESPDDELDYTALNSIAELNFPKLRFDLWSSVVPQAFTEEDPFHIFNVIRHSDQLIHNPFESFPATVEKFIRASAEDPKVLAIKMTLYRTGDNSPFIRSLIHAAEQGKQVVCLVELKARFDEERNIYWAQALENAGVHVVYGIVGLKTHAKTALVVRQESDGIRCYAHVGTGNYNISTSKFYTDLGVLTANEELTSELVQFFHYLTGRSLKTDYKNLMIAPVNMFSGFRSLIDRERENAKLGKPSLIIAKMNNMEENDISMSLYNASQAGVDIHLLVRGFCCLRPGVKGLSEKIKVQSTLGRFLEHSRIFYFRSGQENPVDGDFYIGSADWMYRNLHARVEAVVPILDRSAKEKIWDLLQFYINDQRQTWDMKSDGSYTRRKGEDTGVHQILMAQAKQRHTSKDGEHTEDEA